MKSEDLKTREGIKKQLLDLAALANGIKDYQLGALILTAYNRCDDNVTIQNASHISTLELRDGGPYLNGKRIKGLIDMNIDSKVGDPTEVVIKLAANVHGIDDIDKGYSV